MTQEELSRICMEMISNAGEGRTYLFEAMDDFLIDNFQEAASKLVIAEEFLAEAHRIQFEQLMAKQQGGLEIPFNMLLLHAMDLLMITTSQRDMLQKMIQAKLNYS